MIASARWVVSILLVGYICVMALHAGWYMIISERWFTWPIEYFINNWRWYIVLAILLAVNAATEYLETKYTRG